MSLNRRFGGWGVVCGAALLGVALIQSQSSSADLHNRGTERASQLMGATVRLQDNASAGQIVDIILNRQGWAEFLVVSQGDRMFLVPWQAARLDLGQHLIMIDIPSVRFREVPSFTRGTWPNFTDTRFLEGVNRFFNVRPGREHMIEHRGERENLPPPDRRYDRPGQQPDQRYDRPGRQPVPNPDRTRDNPRYPNPGNQPYPPRPNP